MVNLITTDSYFELFPILTEKLKNSANDLEKRNIVFCEAKVSLMAERFLCAKTGGSFNTDVYSFGKFLHLKKSFDKLLSKEGSSMVVKRILSEISLKCFKHSKTGLAPSLYELIMQLKSAKVTPENIEDALPFTSNVLRNKLEDIAKVYREYEKFIYDNGYEDQSSILSYLPSIIEKDNDIKNSDVYLLGYGSFTAQARAIVESLVKSARSVTAILTEGDDKRVFVNETSLFIKNLCDSLNISLNKTKIKSDYCKDGRIILDNVFAPVIKNKKEKTEAVRFYPAENPVEEVEAIAKIIKSNVMKGECRYRDVTVAVPEGSEYKEHLRLAFETLDIPFFIDECRKPLNHPIIKLIVSYVDAYRKNLERRAITSFFKNPFFSFDKNLTDCLENYLIKYNVNYGRIKEPFTFIVEDEYAQSCEELRRTLVEVFESFNVKKMLEHLGVKEKITVLSEQLKNLGEFEEAAVNDQIYEAVINVIEQMELILGGIKLSASEYKNVFIGGISALELSIIPQYNDAVFVGDYKQTALAKAKYLFAVGLTSEVPGVRQDVALLSDRDIDSLEQIKVLIEPKINVINHRVKENIALALSAFTNAVYLSYPTFSIDGSKNIKSEILTSLEKTFDMPIAVKGGAYLTEKQGLKAFSYDCGRFAEGKIDDFTTASSFFEAVGEAKLRPILDRANKEIKKRLNNSFRPLIEEETSPTAIEDYFKCPYRAFLAHALKLKEKEEGKVDVLSVGNIVHEIMCLFALSLREINGEETSNKIFEDVKNEVLKKEEYKKFLSVPETLATVNRLLNESRKYCYQTYKSFINSKFSIAHTEVAFGSGANCKYPPVKLLDGKVRIKGKIDRVDECENYFRVLDYKTGGTDASLKSLFAGVKLQLFLYAAAVSAKDGKLPAGLYYLPVSDKYEKECDKDGALAEGFTLNEASALDAQDQTAVQNGKSEFFPISFDKNGRVKKALDKDSLLSLVQYAVKISEGAAENLLNGVIIPSPYENTCDYCKYKGLCGENEVNIRTLGQVKEETLFDAVKGGNYAEDNN